jgi:hypothetical protein
MVIWKHNIPVVGPYTFTTPVDATIKSFGFDPGGDIAVWFEVDSDKADAYTSGDAIEFHQVEVVATGEKFDGEGKEFVGTAKFGSLMFHCYELD